MTDPSQLHPAAQVADTITRAQARKLVEQALRSQCDPGAYTKRHTNGYESLQEWKARALALVMGCLE